MTELEAGKRLGSATRVVGKKIRQQSMSGHSDKKER